jgi:hypothetical protein
MATVRITLLTGLLLLSLALAPGDLRPPHAAAADAARAADEAFLREAGLKTDGAALLEFFRKRTPTEADQARLAAAVRRLGDNAYPVREKASNDLIGAGRSALPFLRPALNDRDLEIARRARRAIDAIESGTTTALALAATRLLAERRPAGASKALLDYLPFADNDSIEDEIFFALTALGARADKPDPAVIATLKDARALKRSAAALVLGRAPQAEYRALVLPLLHDPDPRVRFRAAQGLVAGKEKEAVSVLIALLGDAPLALAWQAEEILCLLAGEKAPQVTVGAGSDAERAKCRGAWAAWWRERGPSLDLARLDLDKRSLGLTLLIVYDGYANGQGRVWEFGADRKPRWAIDAGVQGPIDGQVLPGNRLLLAEYNTQRVTERDFQGRTLWEYRVGGNPVACQRLPNGNTFIATLSTVMEVTPARKEVYSYTTQQNQVTFARKLRNGHIYYVASNGLLTEMDEKGRPVKSIRVGARNTEWLTFEPLPGGRFLVPRQSENKLVEFDQDGKQLRAVAVPVPPYSAARLPNGNTVVCSMNQSTVFEVDHAGRVIWREQLQGRPFRIARR